MNIARVVGNIISTEKLEAFGSRKLLLIQPLHPDGSPMGKATMAIDYVGAGEGDIVLYGAAPGLAKSVFNIEKAPINELIMGVIDEVVILGKKTVGNDVRH